MFRLSNDLRQYFTKKQYNYKNNDLTLIEAIIGYQLESDDCIDTFEEYADSLGEIFIDYEQDLELLNLHHIPIEELNMKDMIIKNQERTM